MIPIINSNNAANSIRLQVNGEAITHIPQGGMLQLRNIGDIRVHVRTEINGVQVNGAALTIVQLDNETP